MGNGERGIRFVGKREQTICFVGEPGNARRFVHFVLFVPFGSQQEQNIGNGGEVGWSDSSVSHGRAVLNMSTA